MSFRTQTLGVAAALAFVLPAAHAVPIAPGQFISPLPGTTVALEPHLAGTVVEDHVFVLDGTFAQSGKPFSVQVQDRVILSDDGTYDFYYRVTILDKPEGYPVTVRRDGFAGYATSVSYRLDGLGEEGAQSASRTVDGNGISFDFGFELNEGESSYFFFVDTDAVNYAKTGTGRIDLTPSHLETGIVDFDTFAPAAPIPEPASAALMLAGIAGLAGAARRRRG